jgi:hypothetical protein
MREPVRQLAWRLAPGYMSERAHRYQALLYHELGFVDLARTFVSIHGDAVVRGPFAGMRYPPERGGSLQKRIGAYEREIQPWIELALDRKPTRFVDMGAADGFYAIGIARYGIPVDAFELSRTARDECRELASMNAVSVRIHGRATARRVATLDLTRALVLSDCEGAEADIFTPTVVTAMRTATVIIELHEQFRPGVGLMLRQHFEPTHEATVAHPSTRPLVDFPELSSLPESERPRAVSEMRSEDTPWLLFTPRC